MGEVRHYKAFARLVELERNGTMSWIIYLLSAVRIGQTHASAAVFVCAKESVIRIGGIMGVTPTLTDLAGDMDSRSYASR